MNLDAPNIYGEVWYTATTTGGTATTGAGAFSGELAGGGAGWFVASDAG